MKRFSIAIVDDEQAIRKSLAAVLATYGYAVETFSGASEFLETELHTSPNCILLDINMPVLDGLSAQPAIRQKYPHVPIVVMTGYGSIAAAIRAMKQGAFDFVEKPVDDAYLSNLLRTAAEAAETKQSETDFLQRLQERFAALTAREKDVLKLVSDGHTSHSIAENLGIAKKTVDHHRASIMSKMHATSVGQLIRFFLKLHPER